MHSRIALGQRLFAILKTNGNRGVKQNSTLFRAE